MSPIGPESFQRLEEFPCFTSCIKCFGRPIIPPLLTPNRRHELKQLRIAAANKETELLRRKEELLSQLTQDVHHLSSLNHKDFYRSSLQSSVLESRALWYPSLKDSQEGISIAISKFPTSDIYSSVHSGAIVCSNVIEDRHAYTSKTARDSVFRPETDALGCIECSHKSINLGCNLCQAEYSQNFNNGSFATEISPEVPCRTFSLLQQDIRVVNDELNSAVEDTECESLPTVISNPKYIIADTDSESNVTSMTQSTDLEKYMEFSFSSPDNSAVVWDSKSTSHQYALSRSDDASSETIVNTENELTPCASTMAELTDNIEDELSNAEENAGSSDNKFMLPGTLKRAHSVDSYMKIIQTCARSLNVKKSFSEPFNTNQEIVPNVGNETKASISTKTSLLIKEDSKESDESKEIPERDTSQQDNHNKEISLKSSKTAELETEDNDSFQKKHVRQNSYTLDHPSSVLILAHADCTCNFDAKCISPHCSALKGENGFSPHSAFTKEKVDVNISISNHQMKKLSILSSENLSTDLTNTDHLTSTVVDVFPVVEEDSCKKSNSGNTNTLEENLKSSENFTVDIENDTKENPVIVSDGILENVSTSDGNKIEYSENILEKFRENKMRIEQLVEEQEQLWLKLQKKYEEQKKLPEEKSSRTILSTDSLSKGDEKIEAKKSDSSKIEEKVECKLILEKESSSVQNSLHLESVPIPVDSIIQNPRLQVPCETPHPFSVSKDHNLPQNVRASISSSTEFKTPNNSPSKPLEDTKHRHMYNDSDSSPDSYVFQNVSDSKYSPVSESEPCMNGYSCCVTPTLLPHCNNLPSTSNAIAHSSDKRCDNLSACFCDKSPIQCVCCESFNGYCGYINSYPEYFTEDLISSVNIKSSDSKVESLHSQNSIASNVQYKNKNPGDFTKSQTSNNSRKSDILKMSSDSDIALQKTAIKPTTNLELPCTVNNRDRKTSSQLSKEKTKLPMDSVISSINSRTLKNGCFSDHDISISKRIIEPTLLKKFEKLPAFVKGYLTRRLFKTERVKGLIKTLQDTALLIGKLSEELSMKGDSVSESDVDFHRQLIVQLMTTFHNVFDIFCTISTKERMNIIAESRNFRLCQKMSELKPESETSVTTKVPDPALSKKHKLSSATLKALERKRRSAIDSRTYTVEDFKNLRSRSAVDSRTYTIEDLNGFRRRSHSSMSSTKNHSVSPYNIHKINLGLALKRKTANIKSSRSQQNLLYKWVP